MASDDRNGAAKKPLLHRLYVQVLIGIALGVALGHFWPTLGVDMKPLGDGFIKLIKMLLAPIIFGTIVVGIARMGAIHEVGRVGAKALLYFEVMSTLALVIGLVVVDIVKPGEGMNVEPATLDAHAVATYTSAAHAHGGGVVDFLMNIIPPTIVGSFAEGNVLQIILFAVLFGVALGRIG
jgi:aerobic C4-dicarboxylate transport protein